MAASSFAFLHDDYAYLINAAIDPWSFDVQLRMIGVQVPFWLAVRSGTPALAFVLMNTAAAVLCALAFTATLRGAGWTRGEATLAALLFVASEPILRLTIWGAGLQQLLVWAMVFAVLHAVRRSAIEAGTRRGTAWALLAVGFGGLAALCKWQVAWIAVPSAWLWAADSGNTPRASRFRWIVPLGVAAMIVAPLIAEHSEGSSADAGIGRLATNLGDALSRLFWIVVAASAGVTAGTALASGSVRGIPTRLRDRLVARWPTTRRALTMAALSVVPFLFNERYFAEYYVGPATAWIAAGCAPLLADAMPSGRRRWSAAGIAVLLWMPTQTLFAVASSQSPGHQVASWLDEVRAALVDQPPPRAIMIDAKCGSEDATRQSRAQLERLFDLSEQGLGVRWATGWLETPVVLGPSTMPGARPLTYCSEMLPRVRLAASKPAAED